MESALCVPRCRVLLVTDGCFIPDERFYVLPEMDAKKLESLFRREVLKLLLKEKSISEQMGGIRGALLHVIKRFT